MQQALRAGVFNTFIKVKNTCHYYYYTTENETVGIEFMESLYEYHV